MLIILRNKINIYCWFYVYKFGVYFFVNKNIKLVKFVGDKCLMIEELVLLWLKSGVLEIIIGVFVVWMFLLKIELKF